MLSEEPLFGNTKQIALNASDQMWIVQSWLNLRLALKCTEIHTLIIIPMSMLCSWQRRPKYRRYHLCRVKCRCSRTRWRASKYFVGSVETLTMSSARNIENRAKNVRGLSEPNLDSYAMRTLS